MRTVSVVRKMIKTWWWRQYAPLKRRSTATTLHSAISQKAVIFTLSAVRIWTLSYFVPLLSGKSVILGLLLILGYWQSMQSPSTLTFFLRVWFTTDPSLRVLKSVSISMEQSHLWKADICSARSRNILSCVETKSQLSCVQRHNLKPHPESAESSPRSNVTRRGRVLRKWLRAGRLCADVVLATARWIEPQRTAGTSKARKNAVKCIFIGNQHRPSPREVHKWTADTVQLTTDQVEAIQLEAEEGTVYIKLTSRHDVENLLLTISSHFCTVLTNLIGNKICIRGNAHCHSQSIEHTSRHSQRQNNRRTDEVMDSKWKMFNCLPFPYIQRYPYYYNGSKITCTIENIRSRI
jgi:hypothetical protein